MKLKKMNHGLWHSKIGADIAKKKFNFTIDMLQAIQYHTIGNVNMNTMDKIIYVADKTEENRKQKNMTLDLQKAIELSNKDLDKGILYIAQNSIKYSLEKGSLIHPDTINLINKIITETKNKE